MSNLLDFAFWKPSNPFLVENSEHIEFKNFSIHYVRPFHSEAIKTKNGLSSKLEEIGPSFLKNQLAYLTGELQPEVFLFTNKRNIFL